MEQARTGNGSFYSGPVYQKGAGYSQRGSGVGSFLGGLFRKILPILRKGTVAVGREAVNSGTNFINDVNHNVDPRKALKKRSREAAVNLVKKVLHGDGYKTRSNKRKRQSTSIIRKSNIKKKKKVTPRSAKKNKQIKKKKVRDIFS